MEPERDIHGRGVHFLQNVCRKNNGLGFAHFPDALPDFMLLIGIEAVRWLVQD